MPSPMPRILPRFLLGVLLACGLAHPIPVGSAPAEPTRITAADLLKLKQVETPALSPDGKWVVYVVRSMESKPAATDDWEYHTHLWLAAVDGSSAPRQLTRGARSNTDPVWSPDGQRIAFVRGTGVPGEKTQIHVLDLTGGEAQAWTKLDTGAANPRWSPDGKRLLFTSNFNYAQTRDALEKAGKPAKPAWPQEKPRREPNDTANWGLKKKGDKPVEEKNAAKADPDGSLQDIREWLAKNEAEANPRVTTRLNFLAEGDLALEPQLAQLHVMDAAPDAKPEPVALGFANYGAAEWMPDGTAIVVTGPREPGQHPDRSRLRALYSINFATGEPKLLIERPDANYANPTPSPDGKWIAFTYQTGGDFTFDQSKVALVPSGGGAVIDLTMGLDRNAGAPKWSPDSQWLYFTAPTNGGVPLYRVAAKPGAEPEKLTDLESGVRDFDVSAGGVVLSWGNPANPWELVAADAEAGQPRTLSAHNSEWLRGKELSAYERHSYVNKEGLTIEYWTMKPVPFDPARKYPLLVQIHGGPSAMWGPGEPSTWHEFQFFAARGYAIVFANPRGSGGYGRAFQSANFRDWGVGPGNDVLGAADYAVKEPHVDKNRQVITGGSYGGYLTAWIIGHDQRFKAAVAQRGVYDLSVFHGEGNAWGLIPLYWGGFPWDAKVRRILDRESPINYVNDIKTPLLIKHGDVDYRTGVIQSQMLYKALKQLGREVEYVRYPRATHELSRSGEPKQRLDRLVRFEEFFRRYIGEN